MSFDSAKAFLRENGAETIEHPGGTLYAHLCRVADRLAELGAGRDLQLAGLTHATYGTDGFPRPLLDPSARDRLRAVIGAPAEDLVYLYGACDRDKTWPVLAETATVHDRFTGQAVRLDGARLMPFVDLCVVNELDVIEHNPALLAEHGAYFHDLFDRWALVTSPDVADEAQRVLTGI
ncbi:hypothetical protein BJY16_006088 [Actinoplanes octamycinicus]|uniref:DUF6817 domain-containing protein n=1 Tax=Actinoplanes octamycinicus TaxID=135948 RepID=A0A7W7H296_9ACTN|nr:hypothetical protein [Actinoplanes octamycinicus]MBB4742629.1 hypothetical protein [Actinoplanes octamycinicus]GIE60967.1 hypothetical protein Aoc01nite_63690 [Actinoplanes octamycinicus]